MWPLKSIISEKWKAKLRISTHIYGASWRDRTLKMNIPIYLLGIPINLGMWPLKSIVLTTCYIEAFNTHLRGFQKDRWENNQSEGHMPRFTLRNEPLKWICLLGKMSPVLTVSTHIYGFSNKIYGKTFIFRVNLGMWPLKLIISEKQALFWGFQHTFMGCSWEIGLLSKWNVFPSISLEFP